jgi:hypothetical protein
MRLLRTAWLFLAPRDVLNQIHRTLKMERETLEDAARLIEFWKHEARAGYGYALDNAVAHRIHCEQPEVDLREDLDAEICALRDHLARIEEMVG